MSTPDERAAIDDLSRAYEAQGMELLRQVVSDVPTERADDGLRERIGTIQRRHRLCRVMVARQPEYRCLCGWRSPGRDCTWTDHPEHVADAVIRELGLRECRDPGCDCLHQFVTD